MKVENESAGIYESNQHASGDDVINAAMDILRQRMSRDDIMNSPESSFNYLTLKYSEQAQEVFGILILDQQHQLLKSVELFKGTVASCNVYPRDIIRETLLVNGAAIVCYHNHPSGKVKPSNSDDEITKKIKDVCDLMDIRMLDHVIVGGGIYFSYAQNGKL